MLILFYQPVWRKVAQSKCAQCSISTNGQNSCLVYLLCEIVYILDLLPHIKAQLWQECFSTSCTFRSDLLRNVLKLLANLVKCLTSSHTCLSTRVEAGTDRIPTCSPRLEDGTRIPF